LCAIGLGLVALLLGLAGPSDRGVDLPAEAEVIATLLDVFDEPDEAATDRAQRRNPSPSTGYRSGVVVDRRSGSDRVAIVSPDLLRA
jgi:hypothetical protein